MDFDVMSIHFHQPWTSCRQQRSHCPGVQFGIFLPQVVCINSRWTSVISDGSLKFLTTWCPATEIMDIIFVPSFVKPKVLPDITFSFSLLGSCFLGSSLFSFSVVLPRKFLRQAESSTRYNVQF